MNPEVQAQISSLRAKEASGIPLTMEDCQLTVKLLRAGRLSAAIASDASRRKKAKLAVVDGASLLDELDGLDSIGQYPGDKS